MDLPKRKPNRLPHFDYSTPGAYFVTICTKDRKCIFWESVGASIAVRKNLPYPGAEKLLRPLSVTSLGIIRRLLWIIMW